MPVRQRGSTWQLDVRTAEGTRIRRSRVPQVPGIWAPGTSITSQPGTWDSYGGSRSGVPTSWVEAPESSQSIGGPSGPGLSPDAVFFTIPLCR